MNEQGHTGSPVDPKVEPPVRAVPNALELFAALLRDELTGGEALQVSQQMFTLVADNIPQAIFWKDLDSIYLGGKPALCRLCRRIIGKGPDRSVRQRLSLGPRTG